MMARFGAPALPMCGFSIGFERVCELVDKNAFGTGRAKIAVTCLDDEELVRCLVLARATRKRGNCRQRRAASAQTSASSATTWKSSAIPRSSTARRSPGRRGPLVPALSQCWA